MSQYQKLMLFISTLILIMMVALFAVLLLRTAPQQVVVVTPTSILARINTGQLAPGELQETLTAAAVRPDTQTQAAQGTLDAGR